MMSREDRVRVAVPESRRFRFNGHIHFKKPFRKVEDLSTFVAEMSKYLKSELKKIPDIKVNFTDRPFATLLKGPKGTMTLAFSKDYMDILIVSKTIPGMIKGNDEILNRLASFLDLSLPSIQEVGYSYSEEVKVDSNPIERFVNKSVVAEFSSKSLDRFAPNYLVLESIEGDSRNAVTLEYDRDDDEASIEVSEMKRKLGKFPYGVLSESVKSINQRRGPILSTRGVDEKRSPDKKK